MNIEMFLNKEVEVAVLSAIMKEPYLINNLNEYPVEIFYSSQNQEFFKMLKKHIDKYKEFEISIFAKEVELANCKSLTITYVTQVMTSWAEVRNFEVNVNVLADLWRKRVLKKTLERVDFQKDSNEIKADFIDALNKIETVEDEEDMESILATRLNQILSKEKIKAIQTGYIEIDQHHSFGESQLITICALSGVGKTTWAINLFLNQIFRGIKAQYFSLEVPKMELLNKMLSMMTGVSSTALRNNNLTESEEIAVTQAVNTLMSKNFKIHDKKSSLDWIVSKIREEHHKGNLEIAYIDLVNRITLPKDTGTRAEYIGQITRSLKQLAMELEIPIVLLAQLNRNAEMRQDARPMRSDLKESNSIYEDSDNVFALHRNINMSDASYREQLSREGKLDYNSDSADRNPEALECYVMKGRYSGNDSFSLRIKAETGRIRSKSR